MTMKERLATAINGICADGKIAILDEARARAEAIDPILERLGWDRFSEDFKREFSVSSGRVDYALFVRGKPEAFIEAKRPQRRLGPPPTPTAHLLSLTRSPTRSSYQRPKLVVVSSVAGRQFRGPAILPVAHMQSGRLRGLRPSNRIPFSGKRLFGGSSQECRSSAHTITGSQEGG